MKKTKKGCVSWDEDEKIKIQRTEYVKIIIVDDGMGSNERNRPCLH